MRPLAIAAGFLLATAAVADIATYEISGNELKIAQPVLFESEIHRIENWRHGALERAGYDRESAVVLAASHDVDLHRAVELLERGCSIDLALQILL